MILKWLLKHQWKESFRSILWQRNLASNIFIGIVLALFFLNLLSLGLFIDRILELQYPGQNHIELFNGILIYYFLIDIFLRFFLQKVSGVSIQPYLHLPLPRTQLINFLLFKSLLSFFNLLPLLIMIPFALNVILVMHGISATLAWLISVYVLVLANSFLNLYLGRQIIVNPRLVMSFILAVLLAGLGDYLGYIPLRTISAKFFGLIIEHPAFVVIPCIILLFIYRLDFNFFKTQLYIEKLLGKQKQMKFARASFSYFDRLGEIGEYIALELKLILRNKRARSAQLVGVFVLILMPLFYFSMLRELNYYQLPAQSELENTSVSGRAPGTCRVVFQVTPGAIPQQAHVYITGDHSYLAEWNPARIPLTLQADSSWSRTFYFEPGTRLRYIFTLGSWATELGKEDGKTPDVQTLSVESDTIVVLADPNWKTPRRPIFFDIFLIYMGLLFTGILMLTYGQFMISWESNYFELLITSEVDFRKYFTAKFILLIACGCIFYLLSIPSAFISLTIFKVNSVSFLYNIGVNSFVLLFIVSYTRKRMDLNASMFATQGKGASHYLTIVPTIIIPIFLYLPFALSGYAEAGFIFLTGMGVLGLLFHKQLLEFSIRQFYNQKYNIAAGFRQG